MPLPLPDLDAGDKGTELDAKEAERSDSEEAAVMAPAKLKASGGVISSSKVVPDDVAPI